MQDTRGALYRELYHYLTAERHGARPSSATARDLPRPLARGLVHFYSLLNTRTLETLTVNVADLVATAASQWFLQVWCDLEEAVPALSDDPDGPPPDREQRLQEYRRRFPSAESTWLMIHARLVHASSPAALSALDHLMEEARIACEQKERDTTQERALRRAVTPLADHLNRIVPVVADADRRCRTLFHLPGEWHLLDEAPAQIPWHALETAHARLEQDADMQRLTDALVRGVSRPEVRKVWRKIPVEVVSTTEFDRGLGEVDGLHGISGVQSALPDELGLLATPPTEDLFARKLAEQGVLALHSNRFQTHISSHIVHQWRYVPAKYRPGPIMVCLDTSGSMQGLAEEVAASVLFGIVRSAITYQRRIQVFAVRERLRQISIDPPMHEPPGESESSTGNGPVTAGSPSRVRESDLLALHRFLDASHTGGADISPALDAALEHVGSDNGAVMDLVVISDMQFPRIGAAHQIALDELQHRGLGTAHAITIGEQPMRDPMNVFDHRWHYNTGHDTLSRGRERRGPVGFRYEHIPI
jgi:hypothetical protein